jgi:drug/metabolite transporter (DMT)-like permease
VNDLAASIAAALGSAVGYAFASVLQHRAARLAPGAHGAGTNLLLYLATRPMWLAGLLFAAAALVLHGLALKLGQLTVIQPVLLSGLLFALPASVLLERRRPSVAEWCWALVLVAGIAGFLLAANPSADQIPTDTERLASLVGAGVALAALVVGLGRVWKHYSATLYGLGAGVCYGLTAALIKQVAAGMSHPLHVAVSWFPYALIGIGVAALILSQVAYRAGPLAASLPPLTMAEPVVAVIIGVTAFAERLSSTLPALAGEAAAAVVVTAATVQLARRSGDGPGSARRPGEGPGSARRDRGEGWVAAAGQYGGYGGIAGDVGVEERLRHRADGR